MVNNPAVSCLASTAETVQFPLHIVYSLCFRCYNVNKEKADEVVQYIKACTFKEKLNNCVNLLNIALLLDKMVNDIDDYWLCDFILNPNGFPFTGCEPGRI